MRALVRRRIEPVRDALARRRRARLARDFYRRFVPRGSLAFDVGANVGTRTAIFLELGALVVAVEPLDDCHVALERAFSSRPGFTLVRAALGPRPGEMEIALPRGQSTIASMSQTWIERVSASGRFGSVEWSERARVAVTTLDALIAEHGLPAFCKIDVEGFEAEVLEGLSQPIPTLALEFTPENVEGTRRALDRLESLGAYEYDYSPGESLVLESGRWLKSDELLARLAGLAEDTRAFGDVYARLRA